jgi:hypothetical protein
LQESEEEVLNEPEIAIEEEPQATKAPEYTGPKVWGGIDSFR